MFRKSKIIIVALCLIVSFCFVGIESNASAYTKNSTHAEPSYGENSGYINILVDKSGVLRLYTVCWVFGIYELGLPSMNINVRDTSVEFSAVGPDYFNFTAWELSEEGGHAYLFGSSNTNASLNPFTSVLPGEIVAISIKGNVGILTSKWGAYIPQVSVMWNDDNQTFNKLIQIYNELVKANSNDEVMIDRLESIMQSNMSIDTKLSLLIEEQKKTNTWLEKIFNYLNKSEERQKNQAQVQGNDSISQGTNTIDDKGGGFSDSLGGLVAPMSYSGTDCAWEFPTIKLPSIPGVMDEVVLVQKQPIDFAKWVNAIPSGILLVVQSVLTIGLIVYCFKELYDTISYVLTLRRSSNE